MLICLMAAVHFAGQLRDLIDQADDDAARVERYRQADRADRKRAKHARQG